MSGGWVVSHHSLPFVVGEVSELVDFLGVSFFGGVVVLDIFVDLGEEGESVLVFLFGSVGSLVVGNEVDEFSFSFSDLGSEECVSGLDAVHVEEGECGNSAGDGDGSENFSCSHL